MSEEDKQFKDYIKATKEAKMANKKTLRELVNRDEELAIYKTDDDYIKSFLDDNDYDFKRLSHHIKRQLKYYKNRVLGYEETLKLIEKLEQEKNYDETMQGLFGCDQYLSDRYKKKEKETDQKEALKKYIQGMKGLFQSYDNPFAFKEEKEPYQTEAQNGNDLTKIKIYRPKDLKKEAIKANEILVVIRNNIMGYVEGIYIVSTDTGEARKISQTDWSLIK